jgi:hypothetical protein
MGKHKGTPGKTPNKAPKEPERVSRDMQDYSSEEESDMDGNMAFDRRGKDEDGEDDEDVFNLKGGDSDSGGDDDDSEDDDMVSDDLCL